MSNTKKSAAKTGATDQKEVAKSTSAKEITATVVESFRDKDNYDKVYPIGETIEASAERIQYLAELGLVEVDEEATTTDPPKEGGEGGEGGENDPK